MKTLKTIVSAIALTAAVAAPNSASAHTGDYWANQLRQKCADCITVYGYPPLTEHIPQRPFSAPSGPHFTEPGGGGSPGHAAKPPSPVAPTPTTEQKAAITLLVVNAAVMNFVIAGVMSAALPIVAPVAAAALPLAVTIYMIWSI